MEQQNNIPNLQKPPRPEPIAQTPKPSGGGIGPLIAIVVILLIIIAGGLYFWLSRSASPSPEEIQEETTAERLQEVEANLNTDEFSEIESDLETLDQEF